VFGPPTRDPLDLWAVLSAAFERCLARGLHLVFTDADNAPPNVGFVLAKAAASRQPRANRGRTVTAGAQSGSVTQWWLTDVPGLSEVQGIITMASGGVSETVQGTMLGTTPGISKEVDEAKGAEEANAKAEAEAKAVAEATATTLCSHPRAKS
jgi:hypothetical protein